MAAILGEMNLRLTRPFHTLARRREDCAYAWLAMGPSKGGRLIVGFRLAARCKLGSMNARRATRYRGMARTPTKEPGKASLARAPEAPTVSNPAAMDLMIFGSSIS